MTHRPEKRNALNATLLLIALGCVIAMSAPRSSAQEPGEVLWTFETREVIQSSPALAPDGTIYFGSHDGRLYALNPDGTKKWEFRTAGNLPSSPVIGKDASVYIGSLDRTLYALTPEGRIKWLISPRSSIAATPALGRNGDIYVATAFNRLYAITTTGAKRWEFNAGGNLVSSPLVTPAGLICFGSQDRRFYAVGPDGKARWTYETGDKINSSPALGDDGSIYFGSFDGKLHAINPDGTEKWEYPTGGAIRSSPAIGLGDVILVGSDDGKLHAVSDSGTLRWAHPTGGEVRSSPAVGADGVIYVGSYDNSFHALSPNGISHWTVKADGAISASPVIDANGVVYFASWDKKLYAVKCSSLGLAQTSWPMFRGDAQHAGRINRATSVASTVNLTHLDSQIDLTEPAIVRLFASSGLTADKLAQVEFHQGTNRVGQASESPFALVLTNMPAGSHTFRARAKFKSGQNAQSPAIVVNILPPRPPSPPPSMAKKPTKSTLPGKPDQKPMGDKPVAKSPATRKAPKPQAQPKSSPPKSTIAGSYGGIVHSTDIISHDTTGYILIDVRPDGGYRGELHFAGKAHGLRGRFNEKGGSTLQIARGQDKPLNIRLHLEKKKTGGLLTGSLSNGRVTSEVLADKHVFDKRRNPTPLTGRYTLAIAGADNNAVEFFGNGFGRLNVDESGEIAFEGRLGDGTKVEQTAFLAEKGVWSFYTPVHQDKGCVFGWIRFKEQSFGDIFGQLTWIHPPHSEDPKLKNGFTAQLTVIGSRFAPVGSAGPPLASKSAILALSGDGFDEKTLVAGFRFDDRNRIEFPGPNPLNHKLRISPTTGQFTGSFVHPSTGKIVPLQGVLLQKQNSGAGYFTGPNRKGTVAIARAPDA